MLFKEIAKTLGQPASDSTMEITMIAIDSRKVHGAASEVFFALTGESRDGHDFVKEAYTKGVRHFVVSCKPQHLVANFIVVPDTLVALQHIASKHRGQFSYPVIGITGSNGKTIIKEWLATVLQQTMSVVKSPKSYNSQLGVPLSVWEMTHHNDIGIFEAGISREGEMEKLQKVINPTLGIFTNIGTAHSEGFDTIEHKVTEKFKLFRHAQKVVYCKDHAEIERKALSQMDPARVNWSLTNTEADYFFRQNKHDLSVQCGEELYSFAVKAYAGIFLENLLHVIVACIELGLNQEVIQKGIDQIKPVSMRLELKHGKNNVYILDDTYNNDLSGLSIALDYLQQQRQKKKTTVILSDLLQIGQNHAETYGFVIQLLKTHRVDRVITVGAEIAKHSPIFDMEVNHFVSTASFLQSMPYFGNEMVLVKGARKFQFEQIVSALEEKSHGTILEVNFEALTNNLSVYKSLLKKETRLMVMVKAFAYGGGINEIGRLLEYQRVDYLGVAYIDEALELRSQGIETPIMVLNPDFQQLHLIQNKNIEPEIYNWKLLRSLSQLSHPPQFHLKIETGMNRLGFAEDELPEVLDFIIQSQNLTVSGVFTHLSASEDAQEDSFTLSQLHLFDRSYRIIAEKLGYQPVKHCLNSSGIIRWPQNHYDMVRLGIGLYGFDSSGEVGDLQPVSRLKTIVSQVRRIKKGESVGYGRSGKMPENGEIATVAIGYADGYIRAFGNGQAYMMINGQKAYTIGNICMDMTMLDVTGLHVNEGDEVVVFGQNPTIEQLAQWARTIPYEILTNVSQRVKRVYVSE